MLETSIFSFLHNVFKGHILLAGVKTSNCNKVNIMCLYVHNYTPTSKKRGYTVLGLSVLLSVHPSLTNLFHHTFLSNHASQPLQIWYGALARDPYCHLLNSGPLVLYFLFCSLVHFWTLHLGIARVYSVSKNSEISCYMFENMA